MNPFDQVTQRLQSNNSSSSLSVPSISSGNPFDETTQRLQSGNLDNNVIPSLIQSGNSVNPFDQVTQRLQENQDIPSDVSGAENELGQQIDQGECEQFVESLTTNQKLGDTAYDAFQNQLAQGLGVQTNNVSSAPIGSKIYFAPDSSNGGNGHAGILIDNQGDFISADYDKVSLNNLSTWPQTPIGYVPTQ